MENWLVAHAVRNAWQRPSNDGVLNIAPNRITPNSGAIGFIRDGRASMPLPGEGWWHVYTVDKLHLNFGNIKLPPDRWKKLSTCVNAMSAFMLLYNDRGTTFPLSKARVIKRASGQILLALPQSERYSWLDTETLYWRIYAGYDGGDYAGLPLPTFVEPWDTPNGTQIQRACDRYRALQAAKQGHVTFWLNGVLTESPVPGDIATWDDVEIHVDGRVKRVVDFRCGDLPTFQSTLDSKRKYLLHLPKGSENWTFNNDVEIHVLRQRDGRYYWKHRHLSVRQVTFNDLSIPTERISQLRNSFKNLNDIDDLVIRVVIRDDYLRTPVLFNSQHVHDLYRLEDPLIISAMTGVNSTMPEWLAKNLEQAAYNKVAAAQFQNITRDLCTEAYGYNATSRYTADTPQHLILDNGVWRCTLPDLLAVRSVVYEYDGNGMLLGWSRHSGTTDYRAKNPAARIAEAIAGDVDDAVHIVDNAPDFDIPEGINVTLWLRKLVSGVGTNEYTLAVEGTDYTRIGAAITWTVDRTRRWPTVIYDDVHLLFEQTINVNQGQIRVPILGRSASEPIRTLWTPMETVEVWLNDHPLVFGIDYVVVWPEIVVVSKAWMSDGQTNKVTVRARGVTGVTRAPKTGFVSSGLFSNNSHFDVRDDKVIRVVAGGGILTRNDVVFREDNSVGTDVVPDGFPFSVDDPTIPLRTLVSQDTYAMRDTSRDLDARTEEYLTTFFPTPPPVNPVPLQGWYHLFSPLLNKLLWDYKNKNLILVEDDPNYRISTAQLDRVMEGYISLLQFDPAYIGYDKAFVRMHPHSLYQVVEVDELGFAFLDRVNARYLNSEIQLNQYLKIKG
ncbi:putative virion structural protein [Erwinia phage pEa_SNUABM_8]|nr:putative virion structural protein [Erwinia phage pEa_SNUABM_8]QVW55036.1 hypothetical protein pEaSNUABM4_00283 [Erwinia phage pEa_SNUABM_4]